MSIIGIFSDINFLPRLGIVKLFSGSLSNNPTF
jgi:hypothetical protein